LIKGSRDPTIIGIIKLIIQIVIPVIPMAIVFFVTVENTIIAIEARVMPSE
jgi:hypothetical protein